jgi:protein-S-isoprenylcysteine O-methyltransferase Ste14
MEGDSPLTREAANDSAGVIAPPPLVYAAGLAAGFGLEALLPSASISRAIRIPLGCALLVTGGTLAATFFGAFRRAGTAVDPREPSTALVTTGPYRLTRNPAYLGLALTYTGIAVVSSSLWVLAPLLPVLVVIDRGVIRREERYLERKFGDAYRSYKARTRRWI